MEPNVEKILKEAINAYRSGMHHKALDLLRKALEKSPDSPDILMNLANLEHQLGHIESARKYAEKYLRVHESWEMYDILVDYHYSLGEHEKALEYINRALNICEEGIKGEILKKKREIEDELISKLKVLHFMVGNSYWTERFVSFISRTFNHMLHTFVLYDENVGRHTTSEKIRILTREDLGNISVVLKAAMYTASPETILDGNRELVTYIRFKPEDEKKLMELFDTHDVVIVHSFFNFNRNIVVPFLYTHSYLLKKVAYIPWAGDYFDIYFSLKTREEPVDFTRDKDPLMFWMQKKIMEEVDTVITLSGSLEELSEIFRCRFADPHIFMSYPTPTDFKLLDELRKMRVKKSSKYVLLGNSLHPYNIHTDGMKILKQVTGDETRVVCPLSYPKPDYEWLKEYLESILRMGKDLFGKRFIPLLKEIPPQNYARVLNMMDVGIFNSIREQGLGTIVALLYLGKKVYMAENSLRKTFLDMGIKVYPVERVRKHDFYTHEESVAELNRIRILEVFSEEACEKGWRKFFVEKALTIRG